MNYFRNVSADKDTSSIPDKKIDASTGPNSILDINCSCVLEMGLCQRFRLYIAEQQDKIKKQGGLQALKLFTNAKEQQLFEPILKDVLWNIFNDPAERKIFMTALTGMKRNYLNILTGEKSTMTIFPESFAFDDRIKMHNTVVVSALEEMKKEMKTTKTDFKNIRKFLTKIKPQVAEGDIFDPLARFFYNKRGIFLHSLKMDQYLKIFTRVSKDYRKQNKSAPPQMTSLEEKLKEALGITEDTLNEEAGNILAALTKLGNPGPYFGEDIHAEIENSLSKRKSNAFKQKAKPMFKKGSSYSEDETRNLLRLAKLQCEMNYAGENDFMLILPDLQLFMSIEVKSQNKEGTTKVGQVTSNVTASTDGKKQPSRSNIDNNLIEASTQLKKNSKYTSRLHGSILSNGWGFLKCAAVLPRVIKSSGICKHCAKFILTEDTILKPGALDEWFRATGVEEVMGKMDKQRSYQEFMMLFNRLVNLSCIGIQKTSAPITWEQVEGANAHFFSSGYTATPKGSKPVELSFGEAQNRPIDAFKALYYNQDQYIMLTTEDLFRVIFLSDFGAGKIIINVRNGI